MGVRFSRACLSKLDGRPPRTRRASHALPAYGRSQLVCGGLSLCSFPRGRFSRISFFGPCGSHQPSLLLSVCFGSFVAADAGFFTFVQNERTKQSSLVGGTVCAGLCLIHHHQHECSSVHNARMALRTTNRRVRGESEHGFIGLLHIYFCVRCPFTGHLTTAIQTPPQPCACWPFM